MAVVSKWFYGRLERAVRGAALVGLDVAGRALVADIRARIGIEGHGLPSPPGREPYKQTGELQASIHHEIDRENLVVYIVAEAPYSYYLEAGTSRMAPRPFLRRALVGYATTYGTRHFAALASLDYRGGAAEEFARAD